MSPLYYVPIFESNGLSVQEKLKNKIKITIMVAILDFRSERFQLILLSHLDISFQASSVGLPVQKFKIVFFLQNGGQDGHFGFLIGIILTFLISKSSRYLFSS